MPENMTDPNNMRALADNLLDHMLTQKTLRDREHTRASADALRSAADEIERLTKEADQLRSQEVFRKPKPGTPYAHPDRIPASALRD